MWGRFINEATAASASLLWPSTRASSWRRSSDSLRASTEDNQFSTIKSQNTHEATTRWGSEILCKLKSAVFSRSDASSTAESTTSCLWVAVLCSWIATSRSWIARSRSWMAALRPWTAAARTCSDAPSLTRSSLRSFRSYQSSKVTEEDRQAPRSALG